MPGTDELECVVKQILDDQRKRRPMDQHPRHRLTNGDVGVREFRDAAQLANDIVNHQHQANALQANFPPCKLVVFVQVLDQPVKPLLAAIIRRAYSCAAGCVSDCLRVEELFWRSSSCVCNGVRRSCEIV